MQELMKVSYDNDRVTVSARELHAVLEINTAFKDWFPRMCEYGFTEGMDFNPLKFEQVQIEGEREVKRQYTDYQLTVEMAKEICMLQRNERGKQARQYFIQLEREWNSPEKVMSRALTIANNQIKSLQTSIQENEPKVTFANAVINSNSTILIGELAKLLQQNGVDIGQNRLFKWMRDNGYLKKYSEPRNMPTQKSMDLKLFRIKESVSFNKDGTTRITYTTKVTGKGQEYFINKFIGAGKTAQ